MKNIFKVISCMFLAVASYDATPDNPADGREVFLRTAAEDAQRSCVQRARTIVAPVQQRMSEACTRISQIAHAPRQMCMGEELSPTVRITMNGIAGHLFDLDLDEATTLRLRTLMTANRVAISGFSRQDLSRDQIVVNRELHELLTDGYNQQNPHNQIMAIDAQFVLGDWNKQEGLARFTLIKLDENRDPREMPRFTAISLTYNDALNSENTRYRVGSAAFFDDFHVLNLGFADQVRLMYQEIHNVCRAPDQFHDIIACQRTAACMTGSLMAGCVSLELGVFYALLSEMIPHSIAGQAALGGCACCSICCIIKSVDYLCCDGFLTWLYKAHITAPIYCMAKYLGATRDKTEKCAYSVPTFNAISRVCCFE